MDNRLVAALAGASGVAGSYAVAGYTRQFIVAPIDAAVVAATPGSLVAWTITNVGSAGHLLHIALSFAIATGLLGVTAFAGLVAARTFERTVVAPVLAGALSWGIAAAITGESALAVGAAVPVAASTALGAPPLESGEHDPSRRRALRSGVSAAAFLAAAGGLGWLRSGGDSDGARATALARPVAVTQMLQQAEDRSLDIAGDDVPGLVSSIGGFYNVDIAEFNPDLSHDDWSVTLTGDVAEETTVTFDELTDRPTEHRYLTLRCVGEDLNGRQMDTAVWTGTPIKPLLDEADPDGACDCAMLRAEDDYFVQFPVDALEDAFLAWEMNGQPLPQAHGHPVRVLVPGHWGETNVKWLDEIELLEEPADGYWEQRGWHGTGPVNTVAKLWDVTQLDDGRVELAGHAYAGTRGIDRVEVSTDGGDTWSGAELSPRLPGTDVWRQWRYVYQPEESHEAVVRAVDGEGNIQPSDRSDAFPSGATGWVSERVTL